MTSSNRNTKLDTIKTILIFFVILGHIIQNGKDGIENDINMTVKTCIFSFHMPLFVLISGYFCNTSCSIAKMGKKVIELFATFIVFQAIRIGISGHISVSSLLHPQYTLWYLLCIIYWRIIYYFASKIMPENLIFICSIAICLCSGFIGTNLLSFQRACVFFLFLYLGVYFAPTVYLRK